MVTPAEGPRPVTARELQALIHAEREGLPFLVLRGGDGGQQLVRLPADSNELAIGRNSAADICLAWDAEVSGLHAELARVAGQWANVDVGLARNGSYVQRAPVRR